MPPEETKYEYGFTPEFGKGSLGYWPTQAVGAFWPQRREVLQEPTTEYTPLDGGAVLPVDVPGEYGPAEYGYGYSPVEQFRKKIIGGIGSLLTDPEARARAWSTAKSLPTAALEAVNQYAEDQKIAADALSQGYAGAYQDGREIKPDPFLALYGLPVAAAGTAVGIRSLSLPQSGPYVGAFLGKLGADRIGKGSAIRRAEEKILESQYVDERSGTLPDFEGAVGSPTRGDVVDLWRTHGAAIQGARGKEYPVVEISDHAAHLKPAFANLLTDSSEQLVRALEAQDPSEIFGGSNMPIKMGPEMPLSEAVSMPQLLETYSDRIDIPQLKPRLKAIEDAYANEAGWNTIPKEQRIALLREAEALADVIPRWQGQFDPLGDVPVQVVWDPARTNLASYHTLSPEVEQESIQINVPTTEKAGLSSLLHEAAGHAVSAREGLPGGSSSTDMENIHKGLIKMIDEDKQMGVEPPYEASWFVDRANHLIKGEVAGFKREHPSLSDEAILELAKTEAYNELYYSELGEIAARTLQSRAHMKPRERGYTPPYEDHLGGDIQIYPGREIDLRGIYDLMNPSQYFDYENWYRHRIDSLKKNQ